MPSLTPKPTHQALIAHYESLAKFEKLGIKYETAVRSALHELLEHCTRQFDWKLVPEYAIKRKGQAGAKADGALLDICPTSGYKDHHKWGSFTLSSAP